MENIRISEKLSMTITEAAQVFSIGEKKLRELAEANRGARFWFYNGNRIMIVRDELVKFLANTDSI